MNQQIRSFKGATGMGQGLRNSQDVIAPRTCFVVWQAGQIEVEILPPPSPEMKESARRIYEKHKDAFEEMKRRGD